MPPEWVRGCVPSSGSCCVSMSSDPLGPHSYLSNHLSPGAFGGRWDQLAVGLGCIVPWLGDKLWASQRTLISRSAWSTVAQGSHFSMLKAYFHSVDAGMAPGITASPSKSGQLPNIQEETILGHL